MPHFQEKMAGRDYLTALEQGTLTSLLLAGCFVGALLAGKSYILIILCIYLTCVYYRSIG